jgi:CBS domain-containing protein
METVQELLEEKGSQVWSIGPDATVYDAIKLMAEKGIGALVITEDDHMVGVLSERDYARKIVLAGKTSKDTLIREIMTLRVIYAPAGQRIDDCLAIMNQNQIRHMPVLEGNKLVGMLSLKDLVNEIIRRQQTIIEELETYILG